MAREFVLNPETGRPAVAVTNYQDVELAELEAAVAQTGEALANVSTQLEQLQAQHSELTSAHEDAKSELAAAQAVTGESTDSVDGGSTESGSQDQTGDQPAETSEVPADGSSVDEAVEPAAEEATETTEEDTSDTPENPETPEFVTF